MFVKGGTPARLDYNVACDASWRTRWGRVRGWIGPRALDLYIARTAPGAWTMNGDEALPSMDCVDLDLGFTPATNLISLRRLDLPVGQRATTFTAWLDEGTARLEVVEHIYRRQAGGTYAYEAPRFAVQGAARGRLDRFRPPLSHALGSGHRRVAVPFDAQPVLQGDRLELRPLRTEDWDALYAVASDSLIWEQHPARNRHELDVFRTFFDEALARGGTLVVVDRANGLIVGSSRFHGYDEAKSEVEIGWTFLARLYWGGVYNGELKRLMLDHAFRFVDTVIFVVGPRNVRSQRALAKIGAVRTGETASGSGGDDSDVFRLTKAAFQKGTA